MTEPIPGQKLDEALQKFKAAATNASDILRVQGAMAWMMRGDLAKARESLVGLPPSRLGEVAAAAAALSEIADELQLDGQ